MRVVLDTNILVSALLKQNSNPARILNMALDGRFDVVVSNFVLDEYSRVLKRKKFGFKNSDVEAFLDYFRKYCEIDTGAAGKSGLKEVPQDDRKFVILAKAGNVDYLVTGNTRHFPKKVYNKCSIVSPAEFICKTGGKI